MYCKSTVLKSVMIAIISESLIIIEQPDYNETAATNGSYNYEKKIDSINYNIVGIMKGID